MRRLTLSQVLNSKLPSAIGRCNQDRMEVAAAVNDAQERLVMDPLAPDEGWWGGWVEMLFNLTVVNRIAYLTTPAEIARIIVTDICNRPRPMRNGFYEYLAFSRGHRPQGCPNSICDTQQVFDRPNVATLTPFPSTAPQFIRVFPSNAADVGKRIVIQGPDKNGITVLGTDPVTGAASIGETLLLQLPFSTSANEFQSITGLIKDPTNGPVQIFTVDPSTSTQTLLSSMETNETTAAYRQYLFAGLPPRCCNNPTGNVQVFAQCRLDLVPVVADTDFLLIQSIPALTEEVQATRYAQMDSAAAPALEAKHHRKAIEILNGQLDLYEGKVKTAVSVPLFGSNRLKPSFP